MIFCQKKYDLEVIIAEIIKFPEIEEVLIYGSRALNTQQKGSDVDLAVKGKFVNDYVISTLKDHLENETRLPYFFDITCYKNLENKDLKRHIDETGQLIYSKPRYPS
ncbi:MAG: nucleotidyltransferase domain-containing protein [Candidatus Caenarcaniphilales bacterium]|nr:nucleotidyltransferase domain-containing protein [Candidatus Caenarcaniphilales bacterium]